MDVHSVIVFDAGGQFALWRRNYTSASILTWPFPPRTAIMGLIGAIMGFGGNEYFEPLSHEQCHIAVSFNVDGAKQRGLQFSTCGINTKGKKGFDWWQNTNDRNIVPRMVLRNVQYRIYVMFENPELAEKLESRLKNEESYYTPYLGISGFTAIIKYKGTFPAVQRSSKAPVLLDTVVSSDDVEGGQGICQTNHCTFDYDEMPVDMLPGRKVRDMETVFYETSGQPFKAIPTKYWEVTTTNGKANVTFL